MNQPDPAEIENRVEAAIKAVGKPGDAWAVEFVQTVRPLLAALATAEERAEEAERSERTNRWYVGDEPKLRAIVDAQSEYIAVLEEAHGASVAFAHVHGQHDAPSLVERGKLLREEITKAQANYHKATGPQGESEENENA